ncbi:hypothetical protein LguiA_021656 [Lonicera macranthoides]
MDSLLGELGFAGGDRRELGGLGFDAVGQDEQGWIASDGEIDDRVYDKKFGSGDGEEGKGNSRREIWVSFSLNSGDRRNGDNSNYSQSTESESGSTPPRSDHHQMED